MTRSKPFQFAATGLLIAAYIGLRLWHLADSCLWFDEIFSVHAAEHPWGEILQFAAADLIHPPLFYALLKLWIGIGGEGVFWMRLLPVTAAVVSIFPFISLIRELKISRRVEIISLLFIIVNGSLLKYSQELRMYSLLMCFSLFSMWLFARYFVKGKSYIPLVIANVLLVYTHYFGWFVVVPEVAIILYFQRIKWRRALAMLGIVAASFMPWAVAIFGASNSGAGLAQNIGWMSRPGIIEITTFFLNLCEPLYYRVSSVEPYSIYRVTLPILLIVGAAKIHFFVSWKNRSDAEKQTIKVLYILTAVPIVGALTLSWLLPYSIWGTRHLILVFPLVAIFMGIFLDALKDTRIRVAAFTLLALFTGYAFVIELRQPAREFSWCAWEPLTTEAVSTGAPTIKIYLLEDLAAYHVWFALRDDANNRSNVFKIVGIENVREDKAYFLPRGFDGVTTVNLDGITDEKFWLGFRGKPIEEFERPITDILGRGYRIVDRKRVSTNEETVTFYLLEK